MKKRNLRISGGIFKNKALRYPPGVLRPVMSTMRKTLFQILANRSMRPERSNPETACEGMRVADLFCGSALMALECASRGAVTAIAVESDAKKWKSIYENIGSLIPKNSTKHTVRLYKGSVEYFLNRNTMTFHFIHCDPPFSYGKTDNLMLAISRTEILKNDGIMAIHLPRNEVAQEKYEDLMRLDSRNFGQSALHFYAKSEATSF